MAKSKPKPSRLLPCPKDLDPLLGVVPDVDIFRQTTHCLTTIRRWRREKGLPAVTKRATPVPNLSKGHALLGILSDQAVGILAGLPVEVAAVAARLARTGAGIKGWVGRREYFCTHGLPPRWCLYRCPEKPHKTGNGEAA